MFSNDASKPGRQLCESCHNHYLNKPTTRRLGEPGVLKSSVDRVEASSDRFRNTSHSSQVTTTSEERKVIHKEISRAQRAESSHPIRAVGDVTSTSTPGRMLSGYGQLSAGGPIIRVPGSGFSRPQTSQPMSMPFDPNMYRRKSVASGYNQNHSTYAADRERLARRAYSNEGGYVGTIYAQMVYVPPGKTKPSIIHDNITNIMEAIGNVPVHIGVAELKDLLFGALKERWDRYSKSFPLHAGDVTMRCKDWTPMRVSEPDVDAVLHYFQKKKGKNLVIEVKENKKNIVYLEVPMEIINQVLTLLEEDDWLREMASTGKPKKRVRKNIEADNENHIAQDRDNVVVHVEKRRRILNSPSESSSNARLPSDLASHLSDALQAQVLPTFKELQPLFATQSIDVNVYPVVYRPLPELVGPGTRKPAENFGAARTMKLLLNTDRLVKHKGAFKIALVGGQTSEPIFNCHRQGEGLDHYPVCMKQTFFEEVKEVTQPDGRVIRVKQDIPYDPQRQAQELTMEIVCLVWARALLGSVRQFIQEELVKLGPPSFSIPALEFVEAALAIEQVDGKAGRVWLLEEVIPISPDFPFRKYIGNASCAPIFYQDTGDQDRALFCSFAQHVQYNEMGGKAYVADFQGAANLLTDPQIITSPDLGVVFAAGNIHQEFTQEHKCNKYCEFFKLTPFNSVDDS
ncbi:hypothetical protein AB1N83_001843 [Pleurotus pulmonarius]